MSKNIWTSDKEYLKELLQDIIRKRDVRLVFQPIVSLRDGSVLGYEALSRGPVGSELENPEHMFAVAGRLWRFTANFIPVRKVQRCIFPWSNNSVHSSLHDCRCCGTADCRSYQWAEEKSRVLGTGPENSSASTVHRDGRCKE